MAYLDFDRTTLIHPPLKGREAFVLPLGLCSIATELKHAGVIPKIIDVAVNSLDRKQVVRAIQDSPSNVFGISAFSSHYRYYCWLTKTIREIHPDAIIICGGPLATHQYKLLLQTTETDGCVVGEGEGVIRDLITSRDWKSVPGVASIVDGVLRYKRREKQLSMDELPIVDLDLFNWPQYVEKVRNFNISPKIALNYTVSRGCPHKCFFCSKTFTGYRYKSNDKIIEELTIYRDKFGVEVILLSDELSIPDPNTGSNLAEIFDSLHLEWCAQARVDSVDFVTLVKMRKAGCLSIAFGIESGSQQILDSMRKYSYVNENLIACKAARSAGLDVHIHMMFGYPGEDDTTLRETINFCKNTRCFPPLDHKHKRCITNMTIPIPGSLLYLNCVKKGFINDEKSYADKLDTAYNMIVNLDDVPINLTQWSLEEMLQKKSWFEHTLYACYAEIEGGEKR